MSGSARAWTVDDAGRLVVRPGLSIPLEEIEFRADPSGGPGGQHANKTSTRVEVRFAVMRSPVFGPRHRALLAEALATRLTADGVLRVVSARERSQLQNRRAALARLAELIARGLERPAPRTATRPTLASKRKRVETKKKRAAIKAGRTRPSDAD
ncbi:MAG: alternative ribosome rescue aminoacyl-tRNA hydrolase ArfB [Candidatus Eisenbacteria bacterium]